MDTIIRPKKNLYNQGKCFTKGRRYVIHKHISTEAGLMDVEIYNDLGERHRIGSWWREFEIVDPPEEEGDDEEDEEPHVFHETMFGTHWCDTCNSPYCNKI